MSYINSTHTGFLLCFFIPLELQSYKSIKGGDYLMGDLEDFGQKIKGKLQKAKGNIQQHASAPDDFGTKIKGGISKIKGSFNETAADVKLNNRRYRRRRTRRVAL